MVLWSWFGGSSESSGATHAPENKSDFEAATEPAENAPDVHSHDQDGPQGAIDPETGEINWDCPCLQPALAPPCGEHFRAAFSCFVASKAEPRGSDCVELFVAMQDCFRAHPEVYLPEDSENADEDSADTV